MYRILRLSVLIISLSGGNVVAHADNLSPRVNIGMSEYSGNRIQHSGIDARFFPVWGDEARRRGYDIPEPFGIGYNYMNLRQDIIVDNIWICPYISRHLLSLNPLLACCRRYSRGER